MNRSMKRLCSDKIRHAITILLYSMSLTIAQADENIIRKDIPYVAGGGPLQKLDLYLPDREGFPLVLFLHEGSLTSGDKSDPPYEAIGRNFADAGIGFVIANYRLGPESRWPAMAEDCAAAFAWMKANAGAMHADTAKLFIVGHSSGALIAALLATDARYLSAAGCSLSDISGCVAMGTMLNPSSDTDGIPQSRLDSLWARFRVRQEYESLFATPAAYRDADPSHHITPDAPPFLVLVAEGEQFQPPILEQAERFAMQMKAAGVPVRVEVLKGRTHMTAMKKMAEPDDPTLLRIIGFLSGPEGGQ